MKPLRVWGEGGAGATRLMEAILFGVDPVNTPTYGMVAVLLVGFSLPDYRSNPTLGTTRSASDVNSK